MTPVGIAITVGGDRRFVGKVVQSRWGMVLYREIKPTGLLFMDSTYSINANAFDWANRHFGIHHLLTWVGDKGLPGRLLRVDTKTVLQCNKTTEGEDVQYRIPEALFEELPDRRPRFPFTDRVVTL